MRPPWTVVLLVCVGFSRAMARYDTIVIGLGPAGCTAASTLAQAGKKVLGLEAQDRIGGRVNTVKFGDGVVELGAEWIHGTEGSRVYDLAIKNNVSLIPDDLNFRVYMSDGAPVDQDLVNSLMTYALGLTDDPPENPEPLGQYISRRLIQHINETYPNIAKDKEFIDSFLHFMDLVIDNYEASNSWNDITTQSNYQELGGHQHMSWHRNGYKTLFDILLNTHNNGPGYPNLEIQLNKEVTLINWPQDPSQDVVVTCKDGTSYKARNVIVTVSLGVLKERYTTLFSTLPDEKISAIQNLSIGVIGKIILSFPNPWWPGNSVYTFWTISDRNKLPEQDLWVTDIPGVSHPLGCGNCYTVWTKGDTTKLVETLPEDVVKRKVMEVLRRFMGANTTIPEPTGMLRSTWHSNPYTRGSYSYDNLSTPQYPNARLDLGKPLLDSAGAPRVLFAGEATNPTHFSTVHGAADTGYREAKRLLPSSKI